MPNYASINYPRFLRDGDVRLFSTSRHGNNWEYWNGRTHGWSMYPPIPSGSWEDNRKKTEWSEQEVRRSVQETERIRHEIESRPKPPPPSNPPSTPAPTPTGASKGSEITDKSLLEPAIAYVTGGIPAPLQGIISEPSRSKRRRKTKKAKKPRKKSRGIRKKRRSRSKRGLKRDKKGRFIKRK